MKASLGLDLEELEHAAKLALLEEEGSYRDPSEDELQDLTLQMGRVGVAEANLDSDDDSSDETSSDSDDDSEDG